MLVTILDRELPFRPWRPGDGMVCDRPYAFDSETTPIDEARPWLTPAYVLGAAYDGRLGYFVPRQHAAAFFQAHKGVPVVMHHAAFDLAVIHLLAPALDIYGWVDADQVWDTQLLHRLYTLASEGHTSSGKGKSTLEHCARRYLGLNLPKDVVDSQGHLVRLSYDRWLNRPLREIEPVYLEYLAKDAAVTFALFETLRAQIKQCLETSHKTWGYVSREWLAEQIRRWGWLTHHIQLKVSIVLEAITANGLHLDLGRREALLRELRAVADELRAVLEQSGYCPGQVGCDKALQKILGRLDARHPDLDFARTPTGAYAKSEEALAPLAPVDPFVAALLDFKAVEKLRSSFLDKMGRRVLHPSFDVLKTTGRTSSFGAINAQNLPRDDRVRSCFVPAPGHVFIDADYSAIEMVTLAQGMMAQFGLRSRLADALNAGKDPHRLVAALATGKPETEVTRDERQRAKPINFGKPGGMGNLRLQSYARTSYGVVLTNAEVDQLSEAWFQQFPEMKAFLRDTLDLGEEEARFFDLTPESYFEHTGSRKFLDHPANAGVGRRPHPVLGGMALKVLKQPDPRTRAGRLYAPAELDYFWTQVEARLGALPSNHHHAVRNRLPSVPLQRAAMKLVGRASVFTLTGRLRAQATYSARHNNIFQALAADGAKLALWKLWRAEYRIANFIHDEVLVEVPEYSDLDQHAAEVRRLMIAGMAEVVPDVRIEVECVATTAWSKAAKVVRDAAGRLLAWSPPAAAAEVRHATAP
jgi:DNA polymerase I-like protein with 3'-5' exonuclease and polymerase domains